MGTLRLCRGDIFVGNPKAIAQGCNIKGVMGAGIALQFKNRFPDMYESYRQLCEKNMLPGGTIYPFVSILNNQPVRIYNLMTQSGFHGADIEFLAAAMYAMCADAIQNDIHEITMPFIGAGLGGIEPSICLNIFLEVVERYDILLYLVVQYAEGIQPSIIMSEKHDPCAFWKNAKATEDLRKAIGATSNLSPNNPISSSEKKH